MNIRFNEQTAVFSLTTDHSLYQMKADPSGVLLHLYYGEKAEGDMSRLIRLTDRGFSGNPYELQSNRGFSLDTLPQEYSGSGVGDFRVPAVQAESENGSRSVDLRYEGYT
ncbi:MAG: alpha-galactosidase, partial [Clostridia bacterium]|nr:alpha-galactosidase [Clostridia bacterium]